MILETGLTIGGKSLREHLEVINHRDAIDYVENLIAFQNRSHLFMFARFINLRCQALTMKTLVNIKEHLIRKNASEEYRKSVAQG